MFLCRSLSASLHMVSLCFSCSVCGSGLSFWQECLLTSLLSDYSIALFIISWNSLMNSSLSALQLASNEFSLSSNSSWSLLWSWGGSSATSHCHNFPVHLPDSPVTSRLSIDRCLGTCSLVLSGISSTLLSSVCNVPDALHIWYLPSKFPYCPHITSWCSGFLFHFLLFMTIHHVFVCSHMLGHISLYDAVDWFITNATTIFQNMSKIFYWSFIDTLSKPASMSTAQLPVWYLGNTVLKHILCKNCHRSNRSPLTIYVIVFYAGFSPALEVQKSVCFYTLLMFSQFTKEFEPDIIINGILKSHNWGL